MSDTKSRAPSIAALARMVNEGSTTHTAIVQMVSHSAQRMSSNRRTVAYRGLQRKIKRLVVLDRATGKSVYKHGAPWDFTTRADALNWITTNTLGA